MSKYTTQVRWIIEQVTSNSMNLPISQRVSLACPKIFNFDFPIWLEEYRPTLEKKILMHYFNKEIGFETVALWKFYLEERLNLIMPYYNELYKTIERKYDWLTDTNSTELYESLKKTDENSNYNLNGNTIEENKENFTGTGNSTIITENNQTSKNLKSDLPQSNYNDLDYGTELTENDIKNNSTENNSTTNESNLNRNNNINVIQNSTNNLTSNINDNYQRLRNGAFGNHSLTELLIQYRNSLLNIDYLIIDELKDLFMMIY